MMSETQTNYDRINDLKSFDEEKTGVKGVVDAGTKEIPSIFIRPSEDRSKDLGTIPENENISVPVVDFARRTSEIVQEVLDASKKWGFFQVVNHGIPLELLENMIEGNKMFHEQDSEVKKKYYSREFFSKKVTYFTSHDFFKSNTADWRDSLYIHTMAGEVGPQELPSICRDVIMEYVNHVLKFGDRILMLLSMGLGLKPGYLEDELENSKEGWSLIGHYYPACPEPQLTLGTNGHADNSFITILLQDQIGGLQILHENQWLNIEPVTGAFIVNIGNILQIISNGILKSVFHRVIAKSVGPRISVAFFLHGVFSSKKLHGPVKELTSKENPPLYKEVTIEELITYFFSKSLDEFGIDHFKLRPSEDGN